MWVLIKNRNKISGGRIKIALINARQSKTKQNKNKITVKNTLPAKKKKKVKKLTMSFVVQSIGLNLN